MHVLPSRDLHHQKCFWKHLLKNLFQVSCGTEVKHCGQQSSRCLYLSKALCNMNALASVGWCRTSVRDGIMEKPETVTEVGLMSRNQTVQRTFAAWTMAHPFISSLTLPIQTSQTWRKSEYGKLRAGDSV